MAAIPLVGVARSLSAGAPSDALGDADLASEESLGQLSGALSDAFARISISFALLLLVVIPFSYGAALVGVRALRGEQSRWQDFFAPYTHVLGFAIFSVALLIAFVVPLIAWMIAAVVVTVVATLVLAGGGSDPTAHLQAITAITVVVGLPFILASVYFQFRLIYAGLAIIDPTSSRAGAFSAMAKSWRMTRKQNWPLSVVALYAMWSPFRAAIFGRGIGFVTRGLPEFLLLFCGSYEVLRDREQPQS